MNCAKLEKSPFLQRLYDYLRSRPEGATSVQISSYMGCLNPATEVSALRHNGVEVNCCYDGLSPSGAKVYRYRLGGAK